MRAALRPVVRALSGPVGSVREVRTSEPLVVLTFDDGPEPGGTDRVVDALAGAGASATFFVLVDRAERHPALLRAVLDAGHEVGLHGMDHRRLTRMPPRVAAARITEGRRRLEQLVGREVRWFRPPFGAQSPATWWAARRCGLEPVMWGPTAWDWLDLPVAELARRAGEGLRRGSILLAHDGYAGDPERPDDRRPPAFDRGELVRSVLRDLGDRGLSGCALGRAAGELRRWAWFKG